MLAGPAAPAVSREEEARLLTELQGYVNREDMAGEGDYNIHVTVSVLC